MEASSGPSLSCVFLLRSDARWHGLWRWWCKGGSEEASRKPVQWQVVQDPESPGSFYEATNSAQRPVDKIWRGLILLLNYFLIINLFTLLPAVYPHENIFLNILYTMLFITNKFSLALASLICIIQQLSKGHAEFGIWFNWLWSVYHLLLHPSICRYLSPTFYALSEAFCVHRMNLNWFIYSNFKANVKLNTQLLFSTKINLCLPHGI